uniref:Gem-associated protein 7 n=1 Tax=Equus asinus TaxID=9793 RepID=A0A9L0ICL9_EQUAS|nr:gem-associated protein 7 isoform X1 [Equus asinus]
MEALQYTPSFLKLEFKNAFGKVIQTRGMEFRRCRRRASQSLRPRALDGLSDLCVDSVLGCRQTALRGVGEVVTRTMQTPLTIPVPVLRLPRGPDGWSRGFAPDGRRALLKPEVPGIPESPGVPESQESQEQRARAALRERYLRSLLAMVGRQVSFTLHEGVHVTAHFGATDLDVANFYVSQLQTPIGVQAEALLRCSDIIAYTFKP